MDREAIEFVIDALPRGRTIFYDFEDRFAVLILAHRLREGPLTIAELKDSHRAPLLDKPVVKERIALLGGGVITAADLLDCWPFSVDAYRLTLATWPDLTVKPNRSEHQVTRRGYSLVLQLNMPVSHRRSLEKKVGAWCDYTSERAHPVSTTGELTLAWARIDLDLTRGEALIEELQSDWVRDVRLYAESEWSDDPEVRKAYYSEHLEQRAKRWSQTLLTATLWFLLEELGLRMIFIHTHESGIRLKQIRYGAPPKSIYSDLPKRFCFRPTHNGPSFLLDTKDRHIDSLFDDPETRWHVHTL